MSQYPSAVDMNNGQPAKPQKNWFGRNWLWFIPTIILLPVLCCCGGGGALMWLGLDMTLNMPPYQDTIVAAEQDPTFQQEIGTPATWPDGFELMTAMESANIDFDADPMAYLYADVPVSGPNGTGRLIIDATTNDGGATWDYTSREVSIDATGEVIDLIPAGQTGLPGDMIESAAETIEESLGTDRSR